MKNRSLLLAGFILFCPSVVLAQPEAEPGDGAQPDAPAPGTDTPPVATAPPPAAPPATPPPAAAPSTPAMGYGYGPSSYPAASAAGAPEADRNSQPEPEPEFVKPATPRWQAFIGMRGAFMGNAGYDLFAEDDFAGHGSIAVAATVLKNADFSVAGHLVFDRGIHSAAIRGEATELIVNRLTLGPEFRLHFAPELYVYARPSAGAVRTLARLDESTTGTTLHSNAWLLAVDAFAGIAAEVLNMSKGTRELRFWVAAEGGYGWSTSTDLRFAPDEDDTGAPNRVAAVDLGSLALRGPGFRGMLGVSF